MKDTTRENVVKGIFLCVGYVVSRVRGHDLDIGDNGMLSYSIAHGNADKLFTIDSETGALSTTADMKHISLKAYSLRIEVADQTKC